MGVSYAPPAYYADRLCERGRYVQRNVLISMALILTYSSCYLRNFLAGPPDSPLHQEYDDQKGKIEQDLRQKREEKYGSSREVNQRGKAIKSAKEKLQEDLDKLEVDTRLKQWTFEKAKKAFYPDNGTVKNPWRDSIAGTMFWM
jgi:eukaryotic translation initiation factor 2C